MLALFRNNESFTVFLLVAYIAALRLPAILGWITPESRESGGEGWLYERLLANVEINPVLSASLTAVLVFIQAIGINRLADKYRMMEERTWLPGMLYGLAASCIPDFLFLSPALVATTFLPVALWRIFSVYRRPLVFSTVFDTAVWLTVAIFIYPPALWFLLIGYLSFFSLRSFSVREQMVYWAGVVVVLIISQTALYWFDLTEQFWHLQLKNTISKPILHIPDDTQLSLSIGFVALLLLIVTLGFNIYYYRRIIQVKKYINILYWFLLVGTFSAFFHPGATLDGFLLCMPTAGIFLGYLFQYSRNNPLMELFHLALFATVFVIQFWDRVT